ncbi:ATP-binding protein [Candidatus Parcubacteria bacterium]|nr:ATP-binding protein [Candidatus Parcubacteria bacterium]
MLYRRKIQQKISKWLLKDEIIILNGPRQVGKTSLLKLLQTELKRKGIEEERIFYLNLEELEILDELNRSPKNILNYIKDKNKKNYFFIDEIQYLDNSSNFLKYLYDEHRNKIKLIVTGSSSLELKVKLQDSLVGRKVVFKIAPLCFEEFLQFKKADILDYYYHENIPATIQNKFKKYLDEYLLFGGMPKVVLTSDREDKKILLKNYVSDYMNKDIRYIGKINNLLKFNQLVKVLSNQIGNLLNVNELSNTLNMTRKEIEKHINILEYTFVLHKIVPYHKNIRSQITKMPKIYLFDLGLRNQILNNFVEPINRSDSGGLFENFIYLELKQAINEEDIYFYRTIHKAEIDFIFEKNGVVYPVEAKYKKFSKPTASKVLSGFCKLGKINCPRGYLVNLSLEQKTKNKTDFLIFINFLSKLKINRK